MTPRVQRSGSRVGLVVVSHSARLADGVVEVAAQMGPDVTVVAAGGTADGGIGTDFDAVGAALARADGGAGVVVLYDLGSARMVADLAVESLADPGSAVVVDAPLVEAAVAAVVAAQGEGDLATVAGAAREAGATFAELRAAEPAAEATAEGGAAGAGAAEPAAEATAEGGAAEARAAEPAAEAAPEDGAGEPAGVSARVMLTNDIGLHARPAALLARTLSEVDAAVTVRFGGRVAEGTSVLALMSLGARGGDDVEVSATGPQAEEALRRVADLAARGFDE